MRYSNINLKQQAAINQKNLELEHDYYLKLEQKNENLRTFRHDFNEHIVALQTFVQTGDIDRINSYLERLLDIQTHIFYISVGNVLADTIINNFYDKLDNSIRFKVSGYFNNNCFVEDFDLCTIISNLLNNAYEAVTKPDAPDEKEIYLDIDTQENRITLLMKNTSVIYIDKELENLHTSKSDKQNHGFGLKNIKTAADKYNGFMQIGFNTDKNMFTTLVVLNKP